MIGFNRIKGVKLRQKEEMKINTYICYQGLSAVLLKEAAAPRPLPIPAKLVAHH
jgi:hypothetical protein